jgi:hypothetical protein
VLASHPIVARRLRRIVGHRCAGLTWEAVFWAVTLGILGVLLGTGPSIHACVRSKVILLDDALLPFLAGGTAARKCDTVVSWGTGKVLQFAVRRATITVVGVVVITLFGRLKPLVATCARKVVFCSLAGHATGVRAISFGYLRDSTGTMASGAHDHRLCARVVVVRALLWAVAVAILADFNLAVSANRPAIGIYSGVRRR